MKKIGHHGLSPAKLIKEKRKPIFGMLDRGSKYARLYMYKAPEKRQISYKVLSRLSYGML